MSIIKHKYFEKCSSDHITVIGYWFVQETQKLVDTEGRERNRLMEHKEQEAKTAQRMEAWRQQVQRTTSHGGSVCRHRPRTRSTKYVNLPTSAFGSLELKCFKVDNKRSRRVHLRLSHTVS